MNDDCAAQSRSGDSERYNAQLREWDETLLDGLEGELRFRLCEPAGKAMLAPGYAAQTQKIERI